MKLGEVDRFLVAERDRRALAYFVERLFVAHGLRERLLGRFLRAAGPRLASSLLFERSWTLEPATLSLAPENGRGAPGADRNAWRTSADLLGNLADVVGREEFGSLARRMEDWEHAIFLRDYDAGRRGRLVVFPFGGGSRRPRAVLKLRHRGSPDPPLEREWEALRRLGARLPPELGKTVPAAMGYAAAAETEFLLMSHLPGSSAYVRTQNELRPRQWVERHFRAAAEWLAAFHVATRSPGRSYAPGAEERELAVLSRRSGGGEAPPLYRELTALLRRHPTPLSARHGDFWSRNLLLAGPDVGGIHTAGTGVVDWESFERHAPPWEDLIHFAVTYGRNYPWSRYRRAPIPEAFRHTFLEENHVSRQVRRYFDLYAERTGLARPLLGPFLRLYLLRRARDSTGEARRDWLECERLLDSLSCPGVHLASHPPSS